MADGHGGPRTPAKPAAVSGPGQYSQRTDGRPGQPLSAVPDQPYGQRQADLNAQRIAPLAAAAPPPPTPQPSAGASPTGAGEAAPPTPPPYQGGPFDAPTNRPDEPITAGMDFGAGPGSDVLNMPAPAPAPQGPTGSITPTLQKYAATDATGAIAQLLQAAAAHGV